MTSGGRGMRRRRAAGLGVAVLWPQIRSSLPIGIVIFVAVAISAFVVSSGPRLVEAVSREDLTHTLTEAEPHERNIRVERITRIGAGPVDDPYANITAAGNSFLADAPPTVTAAISGHRWVADTPQLIVGPMPGGVEPSDESTIRFRAQQGIEAHSRLVEGSLPEPQPSESMLLGRECPQDLEERRNYEPVDEVDCHFEDAPVYQVAVTRPTAVDLMMDIGDRALLQPDATDSLYGFLSPEQQATRVILELSGIIEIDPIEDDFWYGDNVLHRPRTFENADFRLVFATGIVAPETYATIFRDLGAPVVRYEWRYDVDPELVTPDVAAVIAQDFREYDANLPAASTSPDHLDVASRLPILIDGFFAQRTEALVMMSTSIAGIIAVAAGVVLVLSILIVQREKHAIVLVRGRGASPRQVAANTLAKGLVWTAPATGVGYIAAVMAVPDTSAGDAVRAALTLGSLAVLAIMFAALPLTRAPLGELLQSRRAAQGMRSRRIVLDILIVVLGLGTLVSLRRRAQIDAANSLETEVDALLAVAPALIAIGAGVIAARLYDPLMRFAAWISSLGRGLVAFVGFRRIVRQGDAERLPLVVIVLAVALFGFATILNETMSTSQRTAALGEVGADFRIESLTTGGAIASPVDPGVVTGVESWSEAAYFTDTGVDVGGASRPVPLLAIDVDAQRRVLDRHRIDLDILPSLRSVPAPAGDDEARLPVIVSAVWPADVAPDPGTEGTLFLTNRTLPIRVVGQLDDFPGLETGAPFVLADIAALAATAPAPIRPTTVYVQAPESASNELSSMVAEQTVGVRLISRYDELAKLTTDPFITWIGVALRAIAVLAIVFATVAAVSSLAISTARRRRDLAYLQTVGLDTAQARSLTLIEQVPMAILAVAMGTLAGVGITRGIEPALAVEGFTGGLVPDDLTVGWTRLGLSAALVLVVLTTAVVIFTAVNRGDHIGRALRMGDES